jgi:hypothetical protein
MVPVFFKGLERPFVSSAYKDMQGSGVLDHLFALVCR